MDISFFTRRYVDRSKNTGFQFEFFCDKCNKGHLTPFRIHALGVVTSIWDATDWKKEKEKDFDFDTLKKDVSRLFLKGKAWIEAYTNAVEEAQKYFKHCARCLKWVCPKSCYNPRANLCQGCAPLTEAEKAALKAEERRKESGSRTKEPAEAVDAPRVCPHCGVSNPVSTFCADCGGKVVQDIFCPGCGCKWSTEKKMKFCPRCGEEMPEIVPRGVKPTVVKSESEKRAQKAVDRAADPFADISSEVKKVAEEYKNLAEDLLGLKPRKSEPATPASTKPSEKPAAGKSAGEKNADGKGADGKSADEKPAGEKKNAESQATAKPSHLSSVKPAPASKSADDESLDDDRKPRTGAKSKPQSRKVTKISKAKRPTAQKKKAPAKKRNTKPNEPKGQSKPKAKKKPKPKS